MTDLTLTTSVFRFWTPSTAAICHRHCRRRARLACARSWRSPGSAPCCSSAQRRFMRQPLFTLPAACQRLERLRGITTSVVNQGTCARCGALGRLAVGHPCAPTHSDADAKGFASLTAISFAIHAVWTVRCYYGLQVERRGPAESCRPRSRIARSARNGGAACTKRQGCSVVCLPPELNRVAAWSPEHARNGEVGTAKAAHW